MMKPPPTDKPLSVMHVCHSCFLLHSAGGTTVLVDPYFGGDFRWKAHDEKHVSPAPAIGPDDIDKLDGIVITHDHPDHCQPDALYKIMSKHRCGLWGPSAIYRRAVESGIDNRRVEKVEAFGHFTVGDIEVTALPNKGSEETKPCMRMSYLFSHDGISILHGGDSHGPSPSWSGHVEGVALALLWPNHIGRTVSFVKPFSVALMHCDKFDPGDFLCGYDQEELRARLRKRSRGGRVLSPAVGEWFCPERPSEEDLRKLRERNAGRRRKEDDKQTDAGRRGSRPPRSGRKGGGRGRRSSRAPEADRKEPRREPRPEGGKDVVKPAQDGSKDVKPAQDGSKDVKPGQQPQAPQG
jgi:phosphoribosyl 1,2-cyclic phosphodiesterase